MLLLDFSQVVISAYMQQQKKTEVNENLLRHTCLNSVRMYNSMFREQYGEFVICTDGMNCWRREVFTYYKAIRRRDREASDIDWHHLFECLRRVRSEIQENLPFRVLAVEGAEADDIIAVLTMEYCKREPIMIVSSDKDFMQLQRYPSVKQYSPHAKAITNCADPERFLKEHIMRGDRSDGVPNFLSADDSLSNVKKRQVAIYEAKLEQWLKMNPEDFCDANMMRNYQRNQRLVDLRCIPARIQEAVFAAYAQPPMGAYNRVYSYLAKNRLSMLIEHMADFKPGEINESSAA